MIVDETANLRNAAEVMLWGKLTNCGQIRCGARPRVRARERQRPLLWPSAVRCWPIVTVPRPRRSVPCRDLTGVINQRHTQRIAGLLQDRRGQSGRAHPDRWRGGRGGLLHRAGRCSIRCPRRGHHVGRDFGPLLPILTFRNVDEVVRQINEGPKPLALYVFSQGQARTRRILAQTSSGGVAINQVVLHYAQGNLPFGGVNNPASATPTASSASRPSHERGVLGWLDQRRQDVVLPALHGPQAPPGFAVPGDAGSTACPL